MSQAVKQKKSDVNNTQTWGNKGTTFHSPYLFDQVPGEAMIGGELQADLRVNVRRGLAATTHDQWELQTVRGADLHGLSFHITNTGARAGLTRETGVQQGGYRMSDTVECDLKVTLCCMLMWFGHLSNFWCMSFCLLKILMKIGAVYVLLSTKFFWNIISVGALGLLPERPVMLAIWLDMAKIETKTLGNV